MYVQHRLPWHMHHAARWHARHLAVRGRAAAAIRTWLGGFTRITPTHSAAALAALVWQPRCCLVPASMSTALILASLHHAVACCSASCRRAAVVTPPLAQHRVTATTASSRGAAEITATVACAAVAWPLDPTRFRCHRRGDGIFRVARLIWLLCRFGEEYVVITVCDGRA